MTKKTPENLTNQEVQTPVPAVPQTPPVAVQPQVQMVPDPRYLIYVLDQFGNYCYDQYGVVIVDTRNGQRVIPTQTAAAVEQQYEAQLRAQQQMQPVQQQSSRIIRGSNPEADDLFLMDEDFFLIDSEKSKNLFSGEPKPKEQSPMIVEQNQEFFNNVAPGMPSMVAPVNILSTVPQVSIPDKVRYTKNDFLNFNLSDEKLAKHLLDKAFANHKELRYSLTPIPGNLHELVIFKNGMIAGKFTCDLRNYAGVGMPIMHGIVGKQYTQNHIVVPLGATKAVEECITAAAYNGEWGVNAITEEKYIKPEMLADEIYATVDMSWDSLPDGRENYKAFENTIRRIDKYFELKSRYRLYGYKNNQDFCLVSDNWVRPFNCQKQESLNTIITVLGNNLTIEEPSGKRIITMGE